MACASDGNSEDIGVQQGRVSHGRQRCPGIGDVVRAGNIERSQDGSLRRSDCTRRDRDGAGCAREHCRRRGCDFSCSARERVAQGAAVVEGDQAGGLADRYRTCNQIGSTVDEAGIGREQQVRRSTGHAVGGRCTKAGYKGKIGSIGRRQEAGNFHTTKLLKETIVTARKAGQITGIGNNDHNICGCAQRVGSGSIKGIVRIAHSDPGNGAGDGDRCRIERRNSINQADRGHIGAATVGGIEDGLHLGNRSRTRGTHIAGKINDIVVRAASNGCKDGSSRICNVVRRCAAVARTIDDRRLRNRGLTRRSDVDRGVAGSSGIDGRAGGDIRGGIGNAVCRSRGKGFEHGRFGHGCSRRSRERTRSIDHRRTRAGQCLCGIAQGIGRRGAISEGQLHGISLTNRHHAAGDDRTGDVDFNSLRRRQRRPVLRGINDRQRTIGDLGAAKLGNQISDLGNRERPARRNDRGRIGDGLALQCQQNLQRVGQLIGFRPVVGQRIDLHGLQHGNRTRNSQIPGVIHTGDVGDVGQLSQRTGHVINRCTGIGCRGNDVRLGHIRNRRGREIGRRIARAARQNRSQIRRGSFHTEGQRLPGTRNGSTGIGGCGGGCVNGICLCDRGNGCYRHGSSAVEASRDAGQIGSGVDNTVAERGGRRCSAHHATCDFDSCSFNGVRRGRCHHAVSIQEHGSSGKRKVCRRIRQDERNRRCQAGFDKSRCVGDRHGAGADRNRIGKSHEIGLDIAKSVHDLDICVDCTLGNRCRVPGGIRDDRRTSAAVHEGNNLREIGARQRDSRVGCDRQTTNVVDRDSAQINGTSLDRDFAAAIAGQRGHARQLCRREGSNRIELDDLDAVQSASRKVVGA